MPSIDPVGYLGGIEGEVLAAWRRKSRNALYRTDPEAWLWDVLGYRWHEKQRQIADDFLHNRRVAVKSSNGVGKSRMMNELATWGIAVHEPGELLIIASGPGMRQISETAFAYMGSNYSRAKGRGFILPGTMTDTRWSFRETPASKSKTLVIGQKPADRDIVGTFQGIRAISDVPGLKTWVFIDEAGAVHADLFVGAEAVTTGAGDNKIAATGNPDQLGTYFHKIFTDPQVGQDWATSTIKAFDLPTFTGEIVYDDPEMQEAMLKSGMIDPEWVEQKKRAWGEGSARYRSKVEGEFPDSDDRSFFSQVAINTAKETDIAEDFDNELVLGLDLARFGEDDSMVYQNRGGRIRYVTRWAQATGPESASRAHRACMEMDATVLVGDSAGLGGPIMDMIALMNDRNYTIIKALGNERSPDPTRWANARAYWFDMLREGMLTGQVDLNLGVDGDDQLREELLLLQYDFTTKGALKIESKKDMKARGVKSPDALDAVVYSYMRARTLMDSPLAGMKPGDKMYVDPWDEESEMLVGYGMPI